MGDDIISSLAIDDVGVDVRVKFVDSRSNGSRDIGGAGFVSRHRTNMTKPLLTVRSVSPKNQLPNALS